MWHIRCSALAVALVAILTTIAPSPADAAGVEQAPNGPGAGYSTAATGGDPVNSFTGNFSREAVDVAITAVNPPLVLLRTFNSLDPRISPLGPGWTYSYAMHLNSLSATPLDIIVVGPQGQSDVYRHSGDGSYTPPPAIHATLARRDDGTYLLTETDRSTASFDRIGRLTRLTDAQGRVTDLDYGSSAQLIAVRDPAGGVGLTMSYDRSTGLLNSVTQTGGEVPLVSYTYDAQRRLQSVLRQDDQDETYAYDGASTRLTQVTDGQGNVLLINTYDDAGRVATQQTGDDVATGERTIITYVTNSDGGQTTTFTYPPAPEAQGWHRTQVDTYDSLHRWVKRVDRPTATKTITTRRVYDANWDLVSQTVDTVDTACRYVLGFAALHNLDPADVGNCLDNEQHLANGDGYQRTTNGLLLWQKATNRTFLTTGSTTWENGPQGLRKRSTRQPFVSSEGGITTGR